MITYIRFKQHLLFEAYLFIEASYYLDPVLILLTTTDVQFKEMLHVSQVIGMVSVYLLATLLIGKMTI